MLSAGATGPVGPVFTGPLLALSYGKISEKTFKKQQNNYTFEYYRFDWLSAPHTPNTKVQTLHSITLYEFN